MLYLDNLHIQNYNNIEDLYLNFSRINLISGEPGNGKSSIQTTLALLLCNVTEGRLEDRINWSNNSKEFNLLLNFRYLNNKYQYSINCGKTTRRELVVPFEEEPYMNSDAYRYIFDNILDPTLTMYSNISEQDKTSSLLFESPAKGLEIIKKIFKVDSLNEKVELMKQEIKDNKERINILDAEKNILSNRIFEFLDEPELNNLDIDIASKKVEQLEQDRKIYIEELKKNEVYKEQLKVYNNSQISLKLLKEDLKEIEDKKVDLGEVFDYTNLNSLKENYIQKEKHLIQIENDLKIYNNNQKLLNTCNQKIKFLKDDINNIDIKRMERCKYNENDIVVIDKNLIIERDLLYPLQAKLKLYTEGKCPTCDTLFDCTDDDLSDIQNKIKNIYLNIVKFEDTKKEIKNSIEEYNIKLNKFNLSFENKNNLSKQLDVLIEEQKSLIDIEKVDDTTGNLRQELKDISDIINVLNKEVIIYESELKEIEENQNAKNVILEKIKIYDVEEPKQFEFTIHFDENEFEKLKKDVQNYNIILNERENIRKSNNKTKLDKRQTERDIEVKIEEISKLNKRNRILDGSQKVIHKDFSSYIISTKSTYLNKKMNEFFQRVYNGKYQIKFEQDKKGVGFYFSHNKIDWHPVTDLSGFERQVFSLGYRMALSTLQNIKLLLLDEVSGAASTTKSLDFYKNLLNEPGIDQFFITTHNDETKDLIRSYPKCIEFYMKDGKVI